MTAARVAALLVCVLGGGCRRQAAAPAADTEARDASLAEAEAEAEAGKLAGPARIVYAGAPGSFGEVIDRVGSAVVTIRATAEVVGGPAAAYPGMARSRSLGSGFVVSRDGYILTTARILAHATEIHVVLSTGDEVDATIAGRDPALDIGLIKIDAAPGLTPIRLGDSDALRLGEWVAAVGNPFGHGPTLSVGVISATMPAGGPSLAAAHDSARGLVQTDADINAANSGGPLINLAGEAIGINTAVDGAGDLGFAIPIARAAEILPQLQRDGRVERAWLGVFVNPVTPAMIHSAGLPANTGAVVTSVIAGSPAADAKLRPGDIIVAIDGEPVTFDALPFITARAAIGQAMAITAQRDGAEVALTLVPAPMPR